MYINIWLFCKHLTILYQALQTVFEQMSDMEAEFPLIRSYVATFAASSVTGQVVTLNELAEPLENGAYYPLFLISLQQMHKIKSKDWLTNLFNESKLDLIKMLPGNKGSSYIYKI